MGDPLLDGLDYDLGEAELGLTFDRIDNRFLPRAGTLATRKAVNEPPVAVLRDR